MSPRSLLTSLLTARPVEERTQFPDSSYSALAALLLPALDDLPPDAACWALQGARGRDALAAIVKGLDRAKDPSDFLACADASLTTDAFVLVCLLHARLDVRKAALKLVRGPHWAGARPALLYDPELREEALDAIVNSATDDEVAALDRAVRRGVIEQSALTRLPSKHVIAFFLAALNNDDDERQGALLQAVLEDIPALLARAPLEVLSAIAERAPDGPEADALRLATGRALTDEARLAHALERLAALPRGSVRGVLTRHEWVRRLSLRLALIHLDGAPLFTSLLAVNDADLAPLEVAKRLFANAAASDEEDRARGVLFSRAAAVSDNPGALIFAVDVAVTRAHLNRASDDALLALVERGLAEQVARPHLEAALASALSDLGAVRATKMVIDAGPLCASRFRILRALARRVGRERLKDLVEDPARFRDVAIASSVEARDMPSFEVPPAVALVAPRSITDEERRTIARSPARDLQSALSFLEDERVFGVAAVLSARKRLPRSVECAALAALACDPEGEVRALVERMSTPDDHEALRREILRLLARHPGAGPLAETILNVDRERTVPVRRATTHEVSPVRARLNALTGGDRHAAVAASAWLEGRPDGREMIARVLLERVPTHPLAVIDALSPPGLRALARALLDAPVSTKKAPLVEHSATLLAPIDPPLATELCLHWSRMMSAGALKDVVARGVLLESIVHAISPAKAFALLKSAGRSVAGLDIDALTGEPQLMVAIERAEANDPSGLPELVEGLNNAQHGARSAAAIEALDLVPWVLEAALLDGGWRLRDEGLVKLFQSSRHRARCAAAILARSDRRTLVQWATSTCGPHERHERASKIARVFADGVRASMKLLHSAARVRVSSSGYGYARLERREIFINPRPLFVSRHGDDVVRGLIYHELGHLLLHASDEDLQCWKDAQELGLHALLNLVADEHLERNLRARDSVIGDALKRCAAEVFRHAERPVPARKLLEMMGETRALELSALGPFVPRASPRFGEVSTVVTKSGEVLRALAAEGDPADATFAAFFSALRLGIRQSGSNIDDEKIDEAIALFKGKRFRNGSLRDCLSITLRLRDIFGDAVKLIDRFDHHALAAGSGEELDREMRGASDDDVQDALREMLEGRESKTDAVNVNRGGDLAFELIKRIERVPFEPARDLALAREVRFAARSLRRTFETLGLDKAVVRGRSRGFGVDRARLARALTVNDPRVLRARTSTRLADLFVGVAIDCSSSMMSAQRIDRARRMAALISEAARGQRGITARFFGFNDRVLYDIGDAQRCAAGGLPCAGGNNDAAAVFHLARLAELSRRSARLLIMVSDGAPSQCTTGALTALVDRLSRRRMALAQIALRPLEIVCFPHYIEIDTPSDAQALRRFSSIVGRLCERTMRGT